jgi:hypothetical protein
LEIGETYWKPYSEKGLDDKTARIYGMITNLDGNVGRLLATLSQSGVEQNTIVIFLTDNGPAFGGVERYNAGMRGQKGTVYEGGIRVPCFVRWPGVIPSGKAVDRLAAHIDLLPTILNACRLSPPAKVRLDGRSLLPLILNEGVGWPDRVLFFQWHRGDEPQPFKNCAVLTQRYKLVNGSEFYDLEADPGEKNDMAGENPERVQRLRAGYEAWFDQVGRPRGYAPPRIVLGTSHENPAVLTRQDWRGAESWRDGQLGYWEVRVARPGRYQFKAEFPESDAPTEARFALNGVTLQQSLDRGPGTCVFPAAHVPSGDGRLETSIMLNGKPAGPRWVSIERLPD